MISVSNAQKIISPKYTFQRGLIYRVILGIFLFRIVYGYLGPCVRGAFVSISNLFVPKITIYFEIRGLLLESEILAIELE